MATHALKEKRRKEGAEAERCVRRILSQLSQVEFAVFNDVRAKYGNIDHLVVSRTGAVFLIETKSHRGKITLGEEAIFINGTTPEGDFIGQITRNIQWLREKINKKVGVNPWIVAILVFPNAAVGRPRILKRVNVIGKQSLVPLILRYPPRSPQRQVWNNRDIFE